MKFELRIKIDIYVDHRSDDNHSDTHMQLIPSEKLKNERDSFRKAREAHIIHKAKRLRLLSL